jgi:hypothetical protein
MRSWTLSELKDKIKNDLDLASEDFISETELDQYFDEAVDEAEAEIHGLYEDYFLTSANIALVSGTSTYSLPSDIYAHKVRAIIYNDGSTVYPIKRIRDFRKFENIAHLGLSGSTGHPYMYIVRNTSAAVGPQIVFYPAAQETSATNVTIWYIRNANRLDADADVLDIPEFANFILQYVKVRCYEKEGHPNLPMALQALQHERDLMLSTLSTMVPDADNEVELDLSHYEDMS